MKIGMKHLQLKGPQGAVHNQPSGFLCQSVSCAEKFARSLPVFRGFGFFVASVLQVEKTDCLNR
jgi:hypothetical protein